MKFLTAVAAFVAIFFLITLSVGRSTECPPPPPGVAPGCRVITVNPAEEMSLLGPNNILDAAHWARRMELDQVITYWREKLKTAPAGELSRPPEAGKPPGAPPPAPK